MQILGPSLTLVSLPDELILAIARLILATSLPAAVRLAQACKSLCPRLLPVLEDAVRRRLRWCPSHTMRHAISSDGRALTKTHANGHDCACAAGPLLPTVGKSAWRIRILDSTAEHDGNDVYVGVCDASGRSEWGLDCRKGILVHLKRNHKGQIVEWGDHRSQPLSASLCLAGQAAGAVGAVVEVVVDHDLSTLSFSVDGGPASTPVAISQAACDVVVERDGRRGGGPVEAVVVRGSLEKGAALRPYASLGRRPDRVAFCDGYVYAPPCGQHAVSS